MFSSYWIVLDHLSCYATYHLVENFLSTFVDILPSLASIFMAIQYFIKTIIIIAIEIKYWAIIAMVHTNFNINHNLSNYLKNFGHQSHIDISIVPLIITSKIARRP